ncbi:hypothetical protein PCANC_12918 [Puccinia coronata f. sp. avenae]|uniref:Glyoxal oxidase N-terminal domain-containing protein n=1 Tax=Puccinia coronata f. sp. avenae TaxID=200324 RepID=A0A2N5TS71_9BASI|nr:hypothetical protein PCASD_17456 [Puccinia coronata f. sp. avenae]PLW39234.1 hypothetical protein PCANC_12918 [Puccinia coronata f. sp. avenae]
MDIPRRYSCFWMHLAIAGMYSMFMSLGQVGATSLPTTPSEVVNPFDATNGTKASTGAWSRILRGHTGVAAMQITVVNDRYALILDRVERNPLKINGHRAWAALYNLDTDEVTPMDLKSNSFCAGGSFLGNGTLINFGGNPVAQPRSNSGSFGPTNGLQSIRFYTPCDDGKCSIAEYGSVKLASRRWCATATRLADGSIMIVGGSKRGGFRNDATMNNPTVEYFPPKLLTNSGKTQIYLPFLERTLFSNLFPIVITLPTPGLVFLVANRDAIVYNYKTNREFRLPRLPNGVRVTYPMTGGGIILPLSPQNGYKPEVLICGGSDLDDSLPTRFIKASYPATTQCARMVITKLGIRKGWQVEHMPQGRIMPDLIMMPDGKVLIVNGARTGVAGYGSLRKMTGNSNAENPSFTPVLYDPDAPVGHRFSSEGLPITNIARLYHSVATLTPSGQVMLAGSNPNPDVTTTNYRTEYRVEWLRPPYFHNPNRPMISALPKLANHNESIAVRLITTKLELAKQDVQAVLLDLGFVTHSTHMNSRLVKLQTRVDPSSNELQVKMPPLPEIYPPGYGWLFVLVNGIPSSGKRIMVGTGDLTLENDNGPLTVDELAQHLHPFGA